MYNYINSLKGAVSACKDGYPDKMNDKNQNKTPNQNKPKPQVNRSSAQPRPVNSQQQRMNAQPPQKGAPVKQNAAAPKKKKKKHSKVFLFFKKLATVIATTLLSLILVMIITGTIVATALTVYVLDFMEETTGITLQELESGSNTVFYGITINEEGEEEYTKLKEFKTDVQRIPVTIDQIPQHVRDAFVYTEDERFYSHDGVDYKRTLSAFLNMFIHIYDTEQGGSTITQQLIKNLTGDDERSPQRKIREIFRAMQLEKTYSKDEILEEYLNFIGFGGPINGIQLASVRYFGKDVSQLTTAEAATLAAIPKSPNEYYPFNQQYDEETGELIYDGKAVNKERQEYVLWQLYDNGAISYDEYQQYLNEKLLYTDSEEYLKLHPEDAAEELEDQLDAYSWVVDAMIYETQDYLCELYNIDESEALKRINKGGFKIYSTVDFEMQNYVEEKFLDINNIMNADSVRRWVDLDGDGEAEEQLPHCAFVALNYDGTIKAMVGAIGEKTDSLVTSYASTEPRQIGSTVKPISTYGLALETDMIHWGSQYKDTPLMEVNGKPWPTNYSVDGNLSVSNQTVNIYYALQKSYNTVPAQLCDALTPASVFDFCTETMGMELDPADEAYSPLSVGSFTYGITLENLVNAYLPYGNNGIQCDAHIVTRIEDGNHQVLYENNGNPRQAVSSETAWVMNRLLRNVVENGTGTAARLQNKVVCGKTGTTDNWYDLTFVGMTRDFVSGITIGYKQYNEALELPTSLKSANVWYNIIGEYADTRFPDTPRDFESDKNVTEAPMCTISGMIAGSNCPKGVTGYWKSTNNPVCNGAHVTEPPTDENGQPITSEPSETTTADPNQGEPTPPPTVPEVPDPPIIPDPTLPPEPPTAVPPAEGGEDVPAA